MLVRSLGWVQLPSDKEQMVADVASALDNLGVRYSIERGELCNVVTATVPADEKTGEPMETEVRPSPRPHPPHPTSTPLVKQ